MDYNINELIEEKKFTILKEELHKMMEADLADVLEELDEEMMTKVFRMLSKDKAADTFAYLNRDKQKYIINVITDNEIQRIISEMFLDDAVDFIEEMPSNVVKRVLKNVSPQMRETINRFLSYPEDSAGTIMTIEYVELKKDITVAQAFEQIRKTGVDKETIYTCYVIDAHRRLLGTVSAKALLLSNEEDLIGDIMTEHVISVETTDDREKVLELFSKYGMLAVPVVDHDKMLVGIITMDDAFMIQEDEVTEDFEIMAAISPSETPYLQTSVLKLASSRILWLLLLMLSAVITGSIISHFENSLSALPMLIAFIPMLMGTGGNSGSQSSVLAIRGMAVHEIEPSDFLKVIWKELRIALICGCVLSIVNFARVLLSYSADVKLAITVSFALYCTVIMAKIIGCSLPMLAKKIKLDPAVVATPLITTVVDATSLLIFFTVAKMMFHL